MSAATIAEPFLLSSYPESSAHREHSAEPVYASLPSSSDANPFVTVAVQGDGIHVLDVRTLNLPPLSHGILRSVEGIHATSSGITHIRTVDVFLMLSCDAYETHDDRDA